MHFATILNLSAHIFNSFSGIFSISSPVIILSCSYSYTIFVYKAIAFAVSIPSPVIILVITPAVFSYNTASGTSARIMSLRKQTERNIRSFSSFNEVNLCKEDSFL